MFEIPTISYFVPSWPCSITKILSPVNGIVYLNTLQNKMMEKYTKALNVKRQIEERFLRIDGIHGLSIGYEGLCDKGSEDICIYFHIHKQKPFKLGLIPQSIMGVKTCIKEAAIPSPQSDRKAYRPLLGGCRIESSNNTNGTLGFIAIDKTDGKRVALSCQHVLTNEDIIIGQPSFSIKNWIGSTVRKVISNHVDAAICSVEKISSEQSILEIGEITGTYTVTLEDIKYGYPIRKRGMATGLTYGFIKHLNYTGYRTDGWRFEDQLYIEGDESVFSSEGDSGAVYVDDYNRIVGLHWGCEGYGVGLGSPIEYVMNELDISIPGTGKKSESPKWKVTELITDFLF